MKRNLLLVCLISFLPFIPILLNENLPHTSDGLVQLPRMVAFFQSIQDGHIPVRWAANLNYGYGMPLFNFIYQTPFWISSLFLAMDFSLIFTFKLLLLFSFILSGVGMYYFANEFFNDEKTAFLVTVLYQFAPFRLIEILTRGALGTIYVYAFFPFLLLGITRINGAINNKKLLLTSTILIAIHTALMILSHNSLAIIFFSITLLFIFFFVPDVPKKILSFLGVIGGLGLSAFYWIPALAEHKYTYGDLFMKDLFRNYFPSFYTFFIPNPINSASLRVAEIAVNFGLIQTLLLFFALFLIIQKRKKSHYYHHTKLVVFSLMIIAVCIFFMNPLSTPVWEKISLLRQFQFPWRFLSGIVFSLALLGGLLSKTRFVRNIRWFVFINIVIVGSTIFYWRSMNGYDYNREENRFWNFHLTTTYYGETDSIWSAGPAKTFPKSLIEIVEGDAKITNIQKKTQTQFFKVVSDTGARLVSNTQYFPGWRVYIDNKQTPIEFQDIHWRGLITFAVPKGNHDVFIRFEESPVRLIADSISLLSTFSFVLMLFILLLKHIEAKLKMKI